MIKRLLLSLAILLCSGVAAELLAQDSPAVDVTALKAEIAEKEAQMGSLQGEIAALKAKIPPTYGWKFGSAGTLGVNFSSFSDWLGAENANTFASSISFSGNGFANLSEKKYFWRNDGNLTVGFTKLNANTEEVKNDTLDYEKTADAINLSSLFGYKFTEKLAASALAEYRSTIISNFNNPGYLDIGVGGTWTPIPELVVVFHPLNYNLVFSDNDLSYDSSLGCKVVADYTKALPRGLAWKSKLSAFISYSDPSNLSNWTWINGFNATLFKKIGFGFELGLRANRQEGFNTFLADPDNATFLANNPEFEIDDLDSDDNPLQTYWILGFTYNL
ncbi:MAG: DUF3078 domain-containing protein [Bacteroidota bacterium]